MDPSNSVFGEYKIVFLQLACRSENEIRAKDLIEMIASPNILSLAIKYANKLGRIHLSAKLSDLMPQFEEQVCCAKAIRKRRKFYFCLLNSRKN